MAHDQQEDFKQDLYLSYAFDIINGKGGGDYIYSLQEDYIYIYQNGVWERLFDIEFMDRVENHIKKITKFPLSIRKQIIENFKHKKYLRIDKFNEYPLINFENYMYDPAGDNIMAHKPEFYSTIRIPYKYNKAEECPLWLKTLDEIMEGDKEKIELLQEFFGYCLVPDMNQKKALLLLGETDTGKSTILFILKDLLGSVNCSSVPLQYLPNPQYTPLLINKMVNIDSDVNKNAGDYEREFKIITSGETVSCNQKHIPTFEFIPKCKIVLAANIFPKITDHSSAFYQRLLVLPCERRFSEKEKNRELHSQLRSELSGIFNWAIQGLWRFKKRGTFREYGFAKEAVEELEDDNNPSNLFFKEHIEIVKGTETEKGELYDKYRNWCDRNRQYPLSSARFSMCIFKKYSATTPKDTNNFDTKKRIWRNLHYVEFKNISEPVRWDEPASDSILQIAKEVNPVEIGTGSDTFWEA